MNSDVTIPNFDYFFEPIIRVLQALGSSATIQEIYDRVCELESFSEEQQAILHKEGPQTEIGYRYGWLKQMLKRRSLDDIIDDMRSQAQENGLTQEILDEILSEDV